MGAGPVVSLPSKKTRALLAYLALPAGRAHPRETLASLLWGGTGDAQARNNLRHSLVELRRALGRAGGLLADGGNVALDPATLDVDVATFERRAADGSPAALASAADLYRGDLLEGFALREAPFDDWLAAERERLRELARAALARLFAHQADTGLVAVPAAIQTAGRLLSLDPLQEDVHRALMRLHSREGRRGAALRQYQLCADVLRRDLGVEPDPKTKQLYRDLLQGPPAAPAARGGSGAPAPQSPERVAKALPPEETPLIGRAGEERRLKHALDQAWHGQGQLVLVVGEAGIGKSRLMRTLVAEAQARGGRVLEGHSYETEQVLGFGPWVDAFRGLDLDGNPAVLSGLEPVWRAELARLLPELGGTGFEPAPASADPRRPFEAVGRMLIALAADAPLLLSLEDVHWADETSLRLLAFVARRIRTARVVIGATLRDEELAGAPVLERVLAELAREPHVLRLNLGRLSEADTAALVQALARTASGADATRRLERSVWALSEGNPFMAVETVRARQETTPSAVTRGLALPERVRQVIVGRLSRLGERVRQLVAVAAVIGREFDFALAARAAGFGEPAAAEGVEELVRRRILHGVGERLAFTHDRIRDVAYLELLPVRRRLLHEQVAAALEALPGGDLGPHYTALARHHRESEQWERAVFYLRHAAEQAAARAAHREAAANLEQALEALAHLPEGRIRREQAIDMRLRLGDHLFILADLERIGVHVRLAKPEVDALEDPRRLERVLALAGTHLRLTGRYRESIDMSERARALAVSAGGPGVAADHNVRHASALYSLGEHHGVIELARQAVDLLPGHLAYEHFGFGHSPAAFALYFLAISLAELGEFAEALKQADESLRVAESVGLPLSVLAAYSGAGHVRLRMGALPDAVAVLERGLRRYDPGEISFWAPILASSLGSAYVLLGRANEAEPLLQKAVEQVRAVGIVANQSIRMVWLGEACLAGARLDVAAQHAGRALDLARAHEERGHEAYALRLLGDIAAGRGPRAHGEAMSRYHEACALAEALALRPLVAHCHLAMGRLHARAVDQSQARASVGLAADMYREMEMGFWLTEAEAALSGATGVRDAHPTARPQASACPRSRPAKPTRSIHE